MPDLHNAHLAFMPLRHSSIKSHIPNTSLNQGFEFITRSEIDESTGLSDDVQVTSAVQNFTFSRGSLAKSIRISNL